LGSKMRPLAGRSTNRAFSAGRGRELSLWIAGSFSNLAAGSTGQCNTIYYRYLKDGVYGKAKKTVPDEWPEG
jgi:hypothetical protein